MSIHSDPEIACILQLAFGRIVPTSTIPLGAHERGAAFKLHDPDLPPQVLLLHYPPHQQARAFRAFTVMRALHRHGFPVPAVYYLGWGFATGDVLLLTDYVEGRGDEGQVHAFFARVGISFAETLAQLHDLPWDDLPDLAVLPLRYSLTELGVEIRRLGTPELLYTLDWIMAHLNAVIEEPYTVLHGEYTLANVLAVRTQIVAVQNWENAVLGDRRMDVGYASAALGTYGLAISNQFVDAYEAVAGHVEGRTFWEVYGALRLLTRLTAHLAKVSPEEMTATQDQVWPIWRGLLDFIEARAGLEL
ncbi:MAG: phosphotransferase [Chloroflexi bacterium]|nr:phosphotransferase [Chloroflexota bacterium]